MILLNREKGQAVSEYLKEINIVPVAISYEFDPCDKDKAAELSAIAEHGSYEKSENEDINSIAKGLMGFKGKIHVEFGRSVVGDFLDSKSIAEEIDRQIINNYKISNNNQSAFDYLTENKKTNHLKCSIKEWPI
jgi:hypothetical protein